ncbi:hypothetical protein [Candidatus Ruthturnera calyptogenae]|nr:hypothetical protein [Candidatus Ruthturnera calyptogenae]
MLKSKHQILQNTFGFYGFCPLQEIVLDKLLQLIASIVDGRGPIFTFI